MPNSSFVLPNAGRRYLVQNIFRFLTLSAVSLCLCFLALLVGRMVYQGANAFYSYNIYLPINFDLSKTDIENPKDPSIQDLKAASYTPLLQDAILSMVPGAKTYQEKRSIFRFISPEASFKLRRYIIDNPNMIGKFKKDMSFQIASSAEMFIKYERDNLKNYDFSQSLYAEFNHKDFDLQNGKGVFRTKDVIAKNFKDLKCGEISDNKRVKLECVLDESMTSKFLRIGNVYAKIKSVTFTPDGSELIHARLLTSFKGDLVREISNWTIMTYDVPETKRKISDLSIVAIEQFISDGIIRTTFPNIPLLTNGDSRNPEQAGIAGSFFGSVMTLFVCLLCALPIGVCAAVYLEEFAPKNALTEFFEVNINNLASVPSIIYGLLGLALLLNIFGLPRSAPLAGGIVLGIMSLPVMIIATRAALRTVPQTTRDAALALGATHVQTFFHHTLPAAIPGIMTGAVLSLSRAIGETAPLLLIGMVAFISDIPQGITDTATVLPVQIFLWTENPETGYVERTAATIIILLALMICMNACAVYFRNKFERKY